MRKTKKHYRWQALALSLCLLTGVFSFEGMAFAEKEKDPKDIQNSSVSPDNALSDEAYADFGFKSLPEQDAFSSSKHPLDDFFVSGDIEQQIYEAAPWQRNYSISYEVKEFTDIVAVTNSLRLQGIDTVNASDEVYAFQKTFHSLMKLFFAISVLIVEIGLFICVVLLIKLQNTRYHELGLLSVLGFDKKQITSMIRDENLLLASFATVINLALLGISVMVCRRFGFPFSINAVQLLFSRAAAFAAVLSLSAIANCRLVHTEPAEALRR